MGADCLAVFPPLVRMNHVCDAAAFLLGCEKITSPSLKFENWHSNDVETRNSNVPLWPVNVTIKMPNGQYRSFYWHWEIGIPGGTYGKGINARSRPDMIALCDALVDLFGGEIQYNDCGGSDVPDRIVPIQFGDTSDDDNHGRVMHALGKIEPLTDEQIAQYVDHAAYNIDGRWKR